MDIRVREENSAVIITLDGRMDAMTASEYDKKFEELILAGKKSFIVNFSGLEYISSAGLRSILASAKQLKTKGGKLIVAGLKGTVKDVFDLSGFSSIFQIFDSEADALSRMK